MITWTCDGSEPPLAGFFTPHGRPGATGQKLQYLLPRVKGAFAIRVGQPAGGLEVFRYRMKYEGGKRSARADTRDEMASARINIHLDTFVLVMGDKPAAYLLRANE